MSDEIQSTLPSYSEVVLDLGEDSSWGSPLTLGICEGRLEKMMRGINIRVRNPSLVYARVDMATGFSIYLERKGILLMVCRSKGYVPAFTSSYEIKCGPMPAGLELVPKGSRGRRQGRGNRGRGVVLGRRDSVGSLTPTAEDSSSSSGIGGDVGDDNERHFERAVGGPRQDLAPRARGRGRSQGGETHRRSVADPSERREENEEKAGRLKESVKKVDKSKRKKASAISAPSSSVAKIDAGDKKDVSLDDLEAKSISLRPSLVALTD